MATVIVLHGRNGHYGQLYELGERTWHTSLGDRVKFIYLKSPPSGEWFTFKATNPLQLMADISRGSEITDVGSLQQATLPLEALINSEAQAVGCHSNIYLIGYSQGGMLALWYSLKTSTPLGGVVVINSAVPVVNVNHHLFPFCSDKPIVHFHGTSDTIVPPTFAQRGHDLVQANGCSDYTLHISPGGHDFTHHVAQRVNSWLVDRIHR